MKKIGIFGGSFSPVHNGHIRAALAFYDGVKLDKLYIMPSRTPPHKQLDGDAAPHFRLDMLRLAFDKATVGGRNIAISDFELGRDAVSYTVDTVEHFESSEEGCELFLLCGTDMFTSLETWHRAGRIFELATIVLVRREDEGVLDQALHDQADGYRAAHGARVIFLPTEAYPASSSEIRTAVTAGEPTPHLPPAVEEYIHNRGLYGSEVVLPKLRERVREHMSEDRFAHTLRVEAECVKLAKLFGLSSVDTHRLRVAGLLHDITKERTRDEQMGICEKSGVPLPDRLLPVFPLWHGFTGGVFSADVFADVVDEEICSAVSNHTYGRPGASLIEKCVQIADIIEDGRDDEHYIAMREILYSGVSAGKSPDRALNEALFAKYRWRADFCVNSIPARDYLNSVLKDEVSS
ncbi:MAG: nicotinate (nicotinamide) nucleotide adenylyltransferase [Oscillospiraceae bacterium]|nr:nicotinate (nicotinamide) nucleotide adenylyltransferase [Oscillospiraceae bacterium]